MIARRFDNPFCHVDVRDWRFPVFPRFLWGVVQAQAPAGGHKTGLPLS